MLAFGKRKTTELKRNKSDKKIRVMYSNHSYSAKSIWTFAKMIRISLSELPDSSTWLGSVQ